MQKSIFPATLVVIILLTLAIGPAPVVNAQAAPEAAASLFNPAVQPWRFGWVDDATSSNVGAYPALVFSPHEFHGRTPNISYYDAVNGNLMLADPEYGGYNCGTLDQWRWRWWCRPVDGHISLPGLSNGDVGTYSSIDFFYPPSINYKVGIAYHDATGHALKFVERIYRGAGAWDMVYHTIASNNLPAANEGLYTALKYDDGGVPHIAYYSSLYAQGSVKVATWLEGGTGGNCGEGSDLNMWRCDVVESGAGIGQFTSLGLNFMDREYMAYYDAANGDLKYAYYAGIDNASCGLSSQYFCRTVDNSAADVGRSAVITAGRFAADPTRIAYYDRTNGKLKYAFQTTTGANCGGGGWWCGVVDNVGAGLDRLGLSMTVDQQGYPIIAYQAVPPAGGVSKLKIARPAAALGLALGNCGEELPGDLFPFWQCTILDSASYGQGMVNVADYTAVAVGKNGLATVVYRVVDDSDHTAHLKYATQYVRTFLPLVKK